jgi:hypothetical protein
LKHLRTAQRVQAEATSSQLALQQSSSTPGAVFQGPRLSSSSDVPPTARQPIASGTGVSYTPTRDSFTSWLASNHKTWENVGRMMSNSTPLDQQRKGCHPVAREENALSQPQSHTERNHESQDHQTQPIIPQKRNKNGEIFRTERKKGAPGDLAPTQSIGTHSTSIDNTSQAYRLDMTSIDKHEDRYTNIRSNPIPQGTPSPSMANSVAICTNDPINISYSPITPKIHASTPHTLQSTYPETLEFDSTEMTLANQERLFKLFGEFLKEVGLNSAQVSDSCNR